MRLEGKVAVVTGAGQGIGEAIALVAHEGASVAVVDLDLKGFEGRKLEAKCRAALCWI